MGSDFNSDATLALRRVHTDPAALEYERQQRRKATRVVAGTHAHDAEDCALLLDALGLKPEDGLTTKGTSR